MEKREIWYEPHPVSAERKAELRGQGYTIVDAQFAPADDRPEADKQPKKGRVARPEAVKPEADKQPE